MALSRSRGRYTCEFLRRRVADVSSMLDTVGFFTRSIEVACRVSKAWLGNKVPTDPSARPSKLLWPKDLFPMDNHVYEQAMETFVDRLAKFMKVRSTQLDLKRMWSNSGRGDGRSLEQYLHQVGKSPSSRAPTLTDRLDYRPYPTVRLLPQWTSISG